MVRSESIRKIFLILNLIILISFSSCLKKEAIYTGDLKPEQHSWLKGKKVFLDPGHGGQGIKDRFRIGPNGVTEEEANLNVAIILNEMLLRSGAEVKMSRHSDVDISLESRISMAEKFSPDILISVHHNGTSRRSDGVNYPLVLYWGSKESNPASVDLAKTVLDEFKKISESGIPVIRSDFSVFYETGTRLLNQTAHLCPGIIGEACFFSDEKNAIRLKDPVYIQAEAEAYFLAISKYFDRGLPAGKLLFSCDLKKSESGFNHISESCPRIYLKIESGNENPGIYDKTITGTLDGVPVSFRKIRDDLFEIYYGKAIYPGGHRFKFQFKNLKYQNSMILSVPFSSEIKKGDYERLKISGRKLVYSGIDPREGLRMLLSALSLNQTGPEADLITYDIAHGFRITGDNASYKYYLSRLYHFYPGSVHDNKVRAAVLYEDSYRFHVDFHGKTAASEGNFRPDCCKK